MRKDLDHWLYELPVIGWIMKRLYAYFKKHTAITDFMHISLGIGIALVVVGGQWLLLGSIFLLVGILGHVYALVNGK